MSRINLVDPQQAEGQRGQLLGNVKKQLGAVPNFMRALANSPSALSGFLDFHAHLGKGKLDLKTRERLALMTAETNGCQYCVSAHTALGAQAGLSSEEITAARRGASEDAKADAAVKFAKAVLDHRGDVTAGELSAVRDAGFGDEEIIEIIGHVAINVWTNLIGKTGQVDIDFPEIALLNDEGENGAGESCAHESACAC